jgi:hypothetical protein
LKRFLQTRWFEIALLALISGLTYLPRIGELTYYRDDWYFLYEALVVGPRALIEVALHTRPIRGPLYALYFSLFGLDPFPYHVVMYLTRLAGGLGALWLFHLIWRGRRHSNFFMSALFVLFPGFLWWVSGFEFQPYVLSVTLQVFSIAFTLKAVSVDSMPNRLGWTVAALLSGWTYLALVEYAIGAEVFRLLCVYLYVRRESSQMNHFSSLVRTLKRYGPHLLIPIVFVIWYQFLFDNWRPEQEAGAQLSRLFSSPLNLAWAFVDTLRSVLNVTLFAWFVPFNQNFYGNRLRDVLLGLTFAALTVAVVYVANRFMKTDAGEESEKELSHGAMHLEMLWLGLLGALGGVLPVILANRVVVFERISQYTLPASLGGIVFLGGLVYSVSSRTLRAVMLSALIGLAALSHHGLAARAVIEEQIIAEFWWQVAWRAPDIKDGTTLVVTYPGVNYGDGDDMVWGPANFIYRPDRQERTPVHIPISASRMESASVLDIIMGDRDYEETDLVIKNITTVINYRNQLIVTQPSQASCVHVMDPRWSLISIHAPQFLHASFQHSKVENILVEGESPTPLANPFGSEPPRTWCYYFQKADLARQRGDWNEIVRLGDEAQALSLHPNDQVEWIPFAQAYAFLGDHEQVRGLSTRINTQKFYKLQACRHLEAMAEYGYPLAPEMQETVDDAFCR